MRIFIHKNDYTRGNVVIREIYQFWWNERGLWQDITGLSFDNGLSLNQPEWQPISLNIYLYHYQRQQILSLQYINVAVLRSINNFWFCVLGNQTANRLQTVIKAFLAVSIIKAVCNTLHALS